MLGSVRTGPMISRRSDGFGSRGEVPSAARTSTICQYPRGSTGRGVSAMSDGGTIESRFTAAVDEFGGRVRAIRDDQWSAPTPCTKWDVRTLVNHLVYELRWMPPLLAGQTIAE